MLHDVEFFQSRLGKIDGFGDAGEYLTTIIKSKEIKSAAPPETAPTAGKQAANSNNKAAAESTEDHADEKVENGEKEGSKEEEGAKQDGAAEEAPAAGVVASTPESK